MAFVTNAFAVVEKIRTVTRLPRLSVTDIPNGLDTPYSPDLLAQFEKRFAMNWASPRLTHLIGSVEGMCAGQEFFARVE